MYALKGILTFVVSIILLALVSNVLSNIEINSGLLTLLLALGIFLAIFLLSYFLIDKLIDGVKKSRKHIAERVENTKEIRALKEITKKEQRNYQEAKVSFGYFSNDKLLSLYEQYVKGEIASDLELLALEEELVKRGLLDHSPMHEKLYLLKKKFFE
jgi:predicted PurR-regulated permease PerM